VPGKSPKNTKNVTARRLTVTKKREEVREHFKNKEVEGSLGNL
jgi:hypothetical protein